jgi:EAL domain-containing protein (putative c-di-GMP-specific phosphodiesterase class I)/chemotaxis signal transduction protein
MSDTDIKHVEQEDVLSQYVNFTLGDETFAVTMNSVEEIIRFPQTFRVPLTPDYLVGLANLRGVVLPVLCLRRMLNLPPAEVTESTRVVVMMFGGVKTGFTVDKVLNVSTPEPSSIKPTNTAGGQIDEDLITETIHQEGQIIQVLDTTQLISPQMASEIEHTAQNFSQSVSHLAQVDQDDDAQMRQLVCCLIEEQEYAFPLEDTQEIVRIPSAITRVPKTDPSMLGIMNLRGRTLALISLRTLFNMEQGPFDESNRVLVVNLRVSASDVVSVGVVRNISDVIQADLLAEKMQKRLSQPFFIGSRQYLMTASMGIALFPMDGDNAETLLQHADQAMYAAKDSGRNGYFFFNEDMQEQAEYFLDVHNDILKGLERNEFFLEYQPILSLKDNLIHHCEALLRWNHPTKGLLYPDYFISVAERTGAIRALGNWVLSQACKDIRTFTEEGVDLQISINRSVSEFHSSQSLESWKGIFKVNGVSPDRIIFEITESLFMDEHPSRVNVVNALQKMGVQFAIDDFGTGYSALNYLRSYPAQYLKIDKSFISDLLIDDQDRTLVEVIIKMGMTLGIHVIAEGVENDDQVQTLKAFGCEYVQGFWLAKAMPLDRVIAFCQSSNSVPTPPHSLTLK